MTGYPIERWEQSFRSTVLGWLRTTYGKENKEVWFVDQDYDLENLIVSDDIGIVMKLKYGKIGTYGNDRT